MSPAPSNVIAVVDDDDDVREVLCALFEVCGHEVEGYRSGSIFLQEAALNHVACLVLDLNMPEMTGLELVAELDNRSLTIPTLLITGRATASIRREALSSGVITVMQKPMCYQQLLRFVSLSTN